MPEIPLLRYEPKWIHDAATVLKGKVRCLLNTIAAIIKSITIMPIYQYTHHYHHHHDQVGVYIYISTDSVYEVSVDKPTRSVILMMMMFFFVMLMI